MADQKAVIDNGMSTLTVCYAPEMIVTRGIWVGEHPLEYALPLFMLQLILVVITTRLFVLLLKPFHQPRVIAEILAGITLGPSVLGRSKEFVHTVFPKRSLMVLETMAHVGLLYFLFLVGVEMDTSVILRTGKKALAIAIAGMAIPFVIGICFSYLLHQHMEISKEMPFILFLAVALSVTAFPVLARILAELKLLNTEIGELAMSSALVNDMCAWVLLVLAIALSEKNASTFNSLGVILCSIVFVGFCVFIVRPIITWMIRRTPEGETFGEYFISFILTGVMVSGFITDAIGAHSVFGAFIFGLVIPKGPLGVTLIEKLEDFVSGILLPLFFAISGLKTDITSIGGALNWVILMLVIFLACAGKVAGTLIVGLFYQMPFIDAVTLGFLMNTKGLIEMIALTVGKEINVIDETSFAIMVISAVIMTGMITPFVTMFYKPTRNYGQYIRRTIQRTKLEDELQILTCIHSPRNVPTIINLLEASNPTKKSPLSVYVLHLVELTGRASAVMVIHSTRKTGMLAANKTQAQSDQIINAFQNFKESCECVYIQYLTAISSYSTMYQDICNLAEEKHVAFIIVPFHKQQTVDGGMEAMNPSLRMLNQNVLSKAPCSVGILVDRGMSGPTHLAENRVFHHIAVLFFGGPDDREALSYSLRMLEHPGNSISVIRFLPGEKAVEPEMRESRHYEREKQIDDGFIKQMRIMKESIEKFSYTEKVANNGEETVAAIRSIGDIHDLFIVGRGQETISPLTSGLTDWSECPELGAIGDLLASSDFASTVSVLVVQQYVGVGTQEDITIRTRSS